MRVIPAEPLERREPGPIKASDSERDGL